MTNHESNQGQSTPRKGVSRRQLLHRAGLGTGVAVTTTGWMPSLARAMRRDAQLPTLIVVYLRGGADGLSWCAPVNDSLYTSSRAQLKVLPPPTGDRAWLGASEVFALPPGALHPSGVDLSLPFGEGHLTFALGAGVAGNWRSHFEAQKVMEAGVGPTSVVPADGWFGRYLQMNGSTLAFRGVNHGTLPAASLAGGSGVATIEDLPSYAFPGPLAVQIGTEVLHSSPPSNAITQASAAAFDALEEVGAATYSASSGNYPPGALGDALRHTASLLNHLDATDPTKQMEAIHVNHGGWDHHNEMSVHAPLLSGAGFYDLSAELSRALGAFYVDMGGASGVWRYNVIVMSEFGRRIQETSPMNVALTGTDHGTGGVMMVMGGGVASGSASKDVWVPGYSGLASIVDPNGEDVAAVTDTRNVVGDVLLNRFCVSSGQLGSIFPGHSYAAQGLVV
ncbi:MAG: DUF1501 domain-containing protein [Planctomycetota bacterium]